MLQFVKKKLTLRILSNFRSDIVTVSKDFLFEITEIGVVMADLISVWMISCKSESIGGTFNGVAFFPDRFVLLLGHFFFWSTCEMSTASLVDSLRFTLLIMWEMSFDGGGSPYFEIIIKRCEVW